MKLRPDDPRLTAFLLGELSAAETAEVVRAAAADPAIGQALRDLQAAQSRRTHTFAPTSGALPPQQRGKVLRAARPLDFAGKVVPPVSQRRSWKSYLIPAAAALVIVAALVLLIKPPADSTPGTARRDPIDATTWDKEVPLEIALLPAPGPADPVAPKAATQATGTASNRLADQAAARDSALAANGDDFLRKVAERLNQTPVPPLNTLPKLTLRDSVPVVTHPVLPLPIHAGRASLSWISHSIRTERKAPAADAVRLEEILNCFNLRPIGGAAIVPGISVTTESLPCPWKPSATLLLVCCRGTTAAAHEVKVSFHADSASVALYRLLGFAPVAGLPPGPLPSRLPAKAATILAIEIEPAAFVGPLGTIEWSVDGKPAASVPVSRHSEAEPSDDARFAALVCAYAQWLVRDQPSFIDADLVASLARECGSPALSADRQDFITLVEQTIALKR